MAIQSLHKIIQLENKLFQEEQLEQEKISVWIKEQQVEIEKKYASKRIELELKNKQYSEQIESDAKEKASEILSNSKKKAELLDNIDDEFLKKALSRLLKLISGVGS